MLEAGGTSGRVDLVAVRRIRAGDELSFDYGEVYWVCPSNPNPNPNPIPNPNPEQVEFGTLSAV